MILCFSRRLMLAGITLTPACAGAIACTRLQGHKRLPPHHYFWDNLRSFSTPQEVRSADSHDN